ncbi:MAG TPA: hypothetical protein VIU86_05565, partial [Gaiellaceae bacterium]
PGGWQSGLFTPSGSAKPAYAAFRFPLAWRNGTLWGQIRPRTGRQPYRIERRVGGHWKWLGGTRWTSSRGWFHVPAAAGVYRVWSPRDRAFGATIS